MKKKIVKLKNLYTGEIVLTDSYNETRSENGLDFIKVFKPENPERKYFVNRAAFKFSK